MKTGIILMTILTILQFEKIVLQHEGTNKKWIECKVNDRGYLEGNAVVYSKSGINVFQARFDNGYFVDSAIMLFENNIKLIYYFNDSLNYEKIIYRNGIIDSKTIVEDGRGRLSIRYDEIIDTLEITKGGGMPKSQIRNKLENLKIINVDW